ncbi:MAG: Maf family protein [Lachnospiraceae bacterium]|nr:Maf family protein [Lachnospiraceae bacterium]
MKVILASTSPRRKELLEQAGISFETDSSDTDESVKKYLTPADYVEELSFRKASAVAPRHPDDIIIGADTVVVFEDEILGKPDDAEDAYKMLSRLSGRTHSVYTGVTIMFPLPSGEPETETFHVKTDVKMYDLDSEFIRTYAYSGEPLDKAGAYGIQGQGALLVERIEGDYCNVVGLPIAELYRRIRKKEEEKGEPF